MSGTAQAPVAQPTPTTQDTVRDKFFDELREIIDKIMPDVVNGAKNSLKEELKRNIASWQEMAKKDGKSILTEMQEAATKIREEMKKDSDGFMELVRTRFLSQLDDWAAAMGADPKVVAGLKMLESPDFLEGIKQIPELIKQYKAGKKEITIRADKLVYAIMTLIIIIVTLVVSIMEIIK